jgi:site-specific recombinase XerD
MTPLTLIAYRNALQQFQSPATVNVHVSALRTWCTWLTAQEYLETNPANHLKLVGRQEPLAPQALKNKEVNALLRAAQRSRHALRNYAILQLLLQTGLRIGECRNLSWEDITFKPKSASALIRAGKGNKARNVPVNASARAALAAYAAPLLSVKNELRSVATSWPTPQPPRPFTPLWISQKGNRLSAPALWRVINNLVRDCAARGLVPEGTTPHSCRHTFAHRYLERHPGDLVGLARLLGHADLNSTKIYTQPTAEELARRVDQLPLNAYA